LVADFLPTPASAIGWLLFRLGEDARDQLCVQQRMILETRCQEARIGDWLKWLNRGPNLRVSPLQRHRR
jgi:hypothetical protein